MKTPSKKLTLKKESLKRLSDEQLQQAQGGSIQCTSRTTSYNLYQLDYQYYFNYSF